MGNGYYLGQESIYFERDWILCMGFAVFVLYWGSLDVEGGWFDEGGGGVWGGMGWDGMD